MSLLEDFLRLCFGAAPPGAPVGAGVSVALGSGYSVEAERAQRVMLLRAACDQARANPSWQPHQPEARDTHCNGNADEVARAFGCTRLAGPDGKPLLADAQVAVLATDPDWEMTEDAARFGAHALKGGLGFAAVVEYPHGHLCPGYPDTAQESALWGGLEPMVSNVGESVGVERLSDAFLLRQKPLLRFYLFKPGSVA